jgi:hypothetical protein
MLSLMRRLRRCGCGHARTPRSATWCTRSSIGIATERWSRSALMAAQAFFYNAIFFTYALVLTTFYGIPSQHVGWYILPFAAGNVLGPLLLGGCSTRSGGGR